MRRVDERGNDGGARYCKVKAATAAVVACLKCARDSRMRARAFVCEPTIQRSSKTSALRLLPFLQCETTRAVALWLSMSTFACSVQL